MEEVEEWMSPRKRFLSALFSGRVDRRAVGSATSVATIEQMEKTGAYFPEAHYEPKKMAKLAAAAYEILGYDCIMPYFSVWIEADAMGAEVDWGTPEKMPDGKRTVFNDPEEVTIPEDFLEKRSTRGLLDALEILKKEYGDEVVIMGKVMGPWTLAYHLWGVKNTLMNVRLNPDKLHRFLDALTPVTLEFGKAQIEAGIDVLMLADHATGDLVSGETYREFLMERHRKIVKKLKIPMVLHICGDTLDRMDYIAQTGFECFHFDSKVDAFDAKRVCGNRISLMGNINNPKTLLYGTPEDVEREADYAARAGVEILAPECAIPTKVKDENLKAIVKVAKRYPGVKLQEVRG